MALGAGRPRRRRRRPAHRALADEEGPDHQHEPLQAPAFVKLEQPLEQGSPQRAPAGARPAVLGRHL
eukprot:9228843-Lingulodinium_polyedra.AAC.1